MVGKMGWLIIGKMLLMIQNTQLDGERIIILKMTALFFKMISVTVAFMV